MALKKKCAVCGTEYKYCNTCPSDLNKPSWMTLFDEENCKDIYNILSAKIANKLTKEEASDKLKQCNLSNLKNFNNKMKERVEEILAFEENVSVFTEENASIEVCNNDINNEIVEKNEIIEVAEEVCEEVNVGESETVESTPVLKKQRNKYSSKKSNKIVNVN